MRTNPFNGLIEEKNRGYRNSTIFDYDIESDWYACFLRWFFTKFVWWFFGPLALLGVGMVIYAICFYQKPSAIEKARVEQQRIENNIQKYENFHMKY